MVEGYESPEVPAFLRTDLHWLMARAARGLGALTEAEVEHHGISTRGFVVLCALAEDQEHNQVSLGQAVAFDKSTMVRVLDDLEASGLVRRSVHPTDRRVRLVAMTPAGRDALSRARRDVTAMQDRLLEVLPRSRRADFLRALLELGAGAAAATFDTKAIV